MPTHRTRFRIRSRLPVAVAAALALAAACAGGPVAAPPDAGPGTAPSAPEEPVDARPPTPGHATPEDALDAFLEFYFDTYESGLPAGGARKALDGIFTADFLRALDAAAAADRCSREASRDREPPLVQGDVFSSLFEKATAVTSVEDLAPTDDSATFVLHFEHRAGEAAQPELDWSDEVTLRRMEDGWRIDDYERGGEGQFMTRGSVKAMLRGVATLCPAG